MRRLSHVELLCLVAVLVSVTVNKTNAQSGVLGFYLNGVSYPNGSTVLRTDIGIYDNALQCTTDSTTCCRNVDGETRAGNFYFPETGAVVPVMGTATDGYYRDRLSQHIRLHRQPSGTITGQFRCAIPQAGSATEANLFINIVDVLVSITSSGENSVGSVYNLTCSVTVNGLTETPTFTWLDPNGNLILPGITFPVMTTGSESRLTFNPLAASDAGRYTCSASLRGLTKEEEFTVFVNTVSISISTTISGTNTAGESYSLQCSVSVSGSTDTPTITWLDPMNNQITSGPRVMTAGSESRLTFNPLVASDAGRYTCRARVGAVTEEQKFRIDVNVISAQVTPSISTSPLTAGQTGFSLDCVVSGTNNLNSPTVTYQWRMDGRALSGQQGRTLSLSPLATSHAGQYTCQATVTSSSLSSDVTITSNTQTVNIQSITAQVTPSISTSPLTAGQTGFSLDCDVSGIDSLNSPTFTYQWRMNGSPVSGQQGRTLSLSPLATSHAGLYTCQVTVFSSSLSSDFTATSDTQTVSIQFPTPLNVSVSHGEINIGSSVTLTCTVELSSAVDVPVTVSTVWSGPSVITPVTNSVMESLTRYTSTAMVSSFGRDEFGEYTCRASVNAVTPSPYFVDSSLMTGTARVTVGVNLSLEGVIYANNSLISITEIGETTSSNSLQCVTDRRPCCATQPNRAGEWFFPDGMRVQFVSGATTFYRDRGDDGTVNLNRVNAGIMSPTGLFCCVVPDAIGDMQRVCADITTGPVLRISYNVVNTVLSVSYSLSCQVTGTSSAINTYQWRRDGNVLSETGSTLSFFSLSQSDAGQYICQVTVNGMTFTSQARVINLPTTDSPPPISTISTNPNRTPGQQGGSGSAGVIAGVIVIVIVIIIGVAVAVVIVVVWIRRRSSKPYAAGSGKSHAVSPVSYTRTTNGGNVAGVGKQNRPQILKFPSDANVTEGEGVYFKIKVSGVPQPTVTWYHDGEPIKTDYAREIESDGSLAIPSSERKHSGVYKAVVINQHGSEERELNLTVSEEGGASSTIAIADMVSSSPIPIPEFGKYVAELHANSNQRFKDLYRALDTGEHGLSTKYATSADRRPLNRFANIVVYDDNRISLEPLSGVEDCQEDYINACYIDGYSVPNKFIATQGPLPKTVVDFWRLIWQEHPPTIVMVTNVTEGTRIKCQQYWPESGKKDFGPFQVIITDQQIFADYTIRTFSVSLGSGRSHKVTQYHFTAWPDHGVPDYATPILAFHRRVKAQHHPSRGPMVVHCSAGVGRTGTLIAIDNVLEQIEKEQVVDIPGAITKIRQRRMKMVQNYEQFAFIHDAILESVTCGDTQIAATNLRTMLNRMKRKDPLNQLNGFQHQFKILEQVSPNPDDVPNKAALRHSNKNRGRKYLPADRWRVILKGEVPDYIHAVYINGYKHHKAFIITEGPMQSTVRNFWKMIYDRKSAVIVMVSDLIEEGQEASAKYWPDSGLAQYGEYTVELQSEERLKGFTIRELSIQDSVSQHAHRVTQFHITCWSPDGHCSNLKSVTDVIEEMTKVQIRSGNKPIVVHCSDTVTRSGMFCAIATTIERCKTEGVVDVFQVVKALRVQKPGAVPIVSQYQAVFETILVYLESFDTYANFQNI